MEIFQHNLQMLFCQLGLADDPMAIETFIQSHHLKPSELIQSAAFFNLSQRQFLQESTALDSDWTEQIDQLDTLLRKVSNHSG